MATKTASPVVYLMEELGDARLRCDQLVRYLSQAAQLVEKSPQRDQIFEVAGHLVYGIPQAAFKLQKALQAVALAASRIDYEELKRQLRPEKVKELEQVLEDVRIRQIDRRSGPLQDLSRKQAADELRSMAETLRQTGVFPYHAAAQLVGALELDSKTANVPDVALGLERLAAALGGPSEDEAPSRVLLASTLRRMLGDACAEDFQGEDEIMATAADWKMDDETPPFGRGGGRKGGPGANKPDGTGPQGEGPMTGLGKGRCHRQDDWKVEAKDDDKSSKFEKGKPADPTKNMTPEDKAKWKAENDRNKDKFKKEGRGSTSRANAASRQVLAAAKQLVDAAQTKDISPMHHSAMAVLDGLGDLLRAMGQPGGQRVLQQAQSKIRGMAYAGMEPDDEPTTIEASEDEKAAKFEKGKPADPTKNMTPEDKAKWKAENDRNKDKFKKDAADQWVAYVEDSDGYMRHFAGPGSKAAMQRKLKDRAWDSLVDDGGSTSLIPLRAVRVELGSGSASWFSKLPSKEKAQLEEVASKKASDAAWKANTEKHASVGDLGRIVSTFVLKESNDLHKNVKAWLKHHLKQEGVALPDGRLDDETHDLIYNWDGKTMKPLETVYKSMMRRLKKDYPAKKKAADWKA